MEFSENNERNQKRKKNELENKAVINDVFAFKTSSWYVLIIYLYGKNKQTQEEQTFYRTSKIKLSAINHTDFG